LVIESIEQLSAIAAKLGCVVLPSPPVGKTYIEANVFDPTHRSVNGRVESKYQKEKKGFCKFYEEVWEELGKKRALTPPETHLLTMLFPYCETNTNYLVTKSKEDKRPLEIADIAGIVDKDESQVRRILKSLMRKNMVARVESGQYLKFVINPELYWKGGDLEQYKSFRLMFYTRKVELRKSIKDAKEQLKHLYVNGKATSIMH